MYAGLKIDDRIKALREFPGKRRILSSVINQVFGGASMGLSAILNSSQFFAPLTHSLTLTRGTGSATFTRATPQTVENNDGYLVQATAEEAAFKGARRIRNLVTASEVFTGWTKEVGVTIDDLGGGESRINFNGAAGAYVFTAVGTLPTGSIGLCSIEAATETGSGTISINEPVQSYFANTPRAVSTTWARIASPASSPTISSHPYIGLWLRAPSGFTTLKIRKLQIEDVTAQTTQTAGEYVSKGVLSNPWHGAGVDGVKWFNTDISGNPIAASTLKGIEIWPAATNRALHSQDFTNAVWVSGGGGIAVTPNTAVAPDGTTTADTLTASGANGTLIQDLGVVASAAKNGALYLKRKTGTGNVDITLDGGTGWTTQTINSSTWTRCEKTQTLADEDFGIRLVTSGDAVYAWQADVTTASVMSPPIVTTTAAVTRDASVDSVPTASNILAAAGTIAFTYTPGHAPSGTVFLWGTYVDASNYTAILHDATNLIFRKRIAGVNTDATIANTFASGTTYKMAASWGAAGQQIALNGTMGTAHVNTAAAQIGSTMQLGGDGNSLQQAGMAFKDDRIWQRQLSASEMVTVTTP